MVKRKSRNHLPPWIADFFKLVPSFDLFVMCLDAFKRMASQVRPLRKQAIFTKRVIMDEIFIFRDSVMPEYQLIEKNENTAIRSFFDFVCFRSGLTNT